MILIRLWSSETCGASSSLDGMNPGKPTCSPPERIARREEPGFAGESRFLSLKGWHQGDFEEKQALTR